MSKEIRYIPKEITKEEDILGEILIAADMMRQEEYEDVRVLLKSALKKLKEVEG